MSWLSGLLYSYIVPYCRSIDACTQLIIITHPLLLITELLLMLPPPISLTKGMWPNPLASAINKNIQIFPDLKLT